MPENIEFKNPGSTASLIVSMGNSVFLVKRKREPFKGCWAFPGGFLECDQESLEEAAIRELKEETHLETNKEDLELLCVHSEPDRDPRGHVIDHVFIVKDFSGTPEPDDDAADLHLFSLNELPPLAFDHGKIVTKYIRWKIFKG